MPHHPDNSEVIRFATYLKDGSVSAHQNVRDLATAFLELVSKDDPLRNVRAYTGLDQFGYDAEMHREAVSLAEITRLAQQAGRLNAADFQVKLARAYEDLLARRGLPPTLKCYPSIQLASGKYFDFSDIANSPMDPYDIASALSKIARCNGHTLGDIAVPIAQHCCIGSDAAPRRIKFEVLMHDAPEFVMGDMTTPLKQLMPDFLHIEDEVEVEMRRRFLLPHPMSREAKAVDLRLAATEKRDVMPPDPPGDEWDTIKGIEPYDLIIEPWPAPVARDRWLDRFNRLWPAHQLQVQRWAALTTAARIAGGTADPAIWGVTRTSDPVGTEP